MANKPVTERLFRKQLNVSPTFLQSVLKPPSNLPGAYIDEGPKDGYRDRLFQDSKFVFKKYADPDEDSGYLPSHKLRITSKKSRRRFDINVIFSYKKVTDYKEIPEGAELVYETTLAPLAIGKPCAHNEECQSLNCAAGKCGPELWSGTLAKQKGKGGTCKKNLDCKDGLYCINSKCNPGFQKKEGEPCSVDVECNSNICKSGKCWFPKKVDVAAPCPPGQKFVGTDPNTGQPICKGSMVDF